MGRLTPKVMLVLSLMLGALGCRPAAREPAALTGVTWVVTEVAGAPVQLAPGQRPATLSLDTNGVATGFAGCNGFRGRYRLANDSLTFSDLMMTKMACEPGLELEVAFTRALDATRRYRLEGNRLVLIDNPGPLAVLEPAP